MKILIFLILFFSGHSFSAPPAVEDYGKNVMDLPFLESKIAHQFSLGRIIDSAYEDVVSYNYSFYYPFKFLTLGFEVVYNNIDSKNIISESDSVDIKSSFAKNQYGLIFNLPFAQNIMNFLNWKYFQYRMDLEVILGKAYLDSNDDESYLSYGLKIETPNLISNFAMSFGLKNTIISPGNTNTSYNTFFLGTVLKY